MGTGPSASPDEVDQALETAVRAVEIMHTLHGNQLQRTRYLAWIVELCLDHGRRDQARQLLDEAFAAVAKTDERYWEAELYRLRRLLLQGEDAGGAEASLEKALALAREREERSSSSAPPEMTLTLSSHAFTLHGQRVRPVGAALLPLRGDDPETRRLRRGR